MLDFIKKRWLIILLSGVCVLLLLIISIMYGKMFHPQAKQIDDQERIHQLEQKLADALARINKVTFSDQQARSNVEKLRQVAQMLQRVKRAKTIALQKGQQNLAQQNLYNKPELSKTGSEQLIDKQQANNPSIKNDQPLTGQVGQDLEDINDALNGVVQDCDRPQKQPSKTQEQGQLGDRTFSTQHPDQLAASGVSPGCGMRLASASHQNKQSEDATRQQRYFEDMSQKLNQQFAQIQATFMEQQAKETQKHCEQTINESLKKSLSVTLR